MRIFNYPLMIAGDMSGNLESEHQQLNQMQIAAVQASWAGSSPMGSLKLQITNDDPDLIGSANVVWSDYTGSTTTVNGDGDFMWNLISIGFNYIRVVYTFSSGTGDLNITVSGKGP